MSDGEHTGLFQSERQREIAAITHEQGRVEVAHLADLFHVTTETIRRDLSFLQEQKLVRRVHGGGVPWENSVFEPRVAVRADRNDAEKRRIAKRAVAELPDRGSVIIDSGSTLTRFAEAMPSDADLRVVTNCLPVAQQLAENSGVETVVLGGRLLKNTMALVDAQVVHALDSIRVDTLFISTDAATAATGLTTPFRQEAAVKEAMIRSARRVVALVDHSKFVSDELVRFARWSDIDVLITNESVDEDEISAIEATGVTVVLA